MARKSTLNIIILIIISTHFGKTFGGLPFFTDGKSGWYTMTVNQADSLKMECPTEGNPKPNITWTLDSVRIDCNDTEVECHPPWSIEIRNADIYAMYGCKVCNGFGCIYREFIIIYYKTNFRSSRKIVAKGDNVLFECGSHRVDLNGGTIWFKHENKNITRDKANEVIAKMEYGRDYFDHEVDMKEMQKLYEKNRVIEVKKSKFVHSVLNLRNVGISFEGWYTCAVLYNSMYNTYVVKSVYLQVDDSVPERTSRNMSKENAAPSFLLTSNDYLSVAPNDYFTIQCLANGYPIPNITWYHNDEKVQCNIDERIACSAEDYSLVIENVSIPDVGIYKCLVCNELGCIEDNTRVALETIEFLRLKDIKVLVQPSFQSVETGENAEIQCESNAQNIVTEWIQNMENNDPVKLLGNFDYRELYYNRTKVVQFLKRKSMILLGIKETKLKLFHVNPEEHMAWYICLQYNDHGYGINRSYLKVYGKPKFIVTTEDQELNETESLSLKCMAKGYPKPDIIWQKDGKQIDCHQMSCYENELHLLKATAEASGTYKCIASNRHGQIEHSCNVRILSVVSRHKEDAEELMGSWFTFFIKSSIIIFTILFVLFICIKIYIKFKNTNSTTVTHSEGGGDKDAADLLKPTIKIEKYQHSLSTANEQQYQYQLDNKWEVSRRHIVLISQLGEGAFGKVMKARVTQSKGQCILTADTVAVKMLRDGPSDIDVRNLVHEMEVMKALGQHMNIINFLGCSSQNGPLWVIVEYAPHGNLKQFLQNHRPRSHIAEADTGKQLISHGSQELTEQQLTTFALQIANGMDYLASKRCIHRDLAARNILVGQDYIMKIADFGLACELKTSDYYRRNQNGLLPLKWMAPESLDKQIFNTQTDVWSYGILLWEIMSYGESPYADIVSHVNLYTFLMHGGRLAKPPGCSDAVYKIMSNCWNLDPTLRPIFFHLANELESLSNLISAENCDSHYMEINTTGYTEIAAV